MFIGPVPEPQPLLQPKPQVFGVSLPTLINVAGKELVFSEFGIGGGTDAGGRGPARTVEQAANGPFFGVYGSYTRKVDPWRNYLGGGFRVCLRFWVQRERPGAVLMQVAAGMQGQSPT